jgi:hypothetical protein
MAMTPRNEGICYGLCIALVGFLALQMLPLNFHALPSARLGTLPRIAQQVSTPKSISGLRAETVAFANESIPPFVLVRNIAQKAVMRIEKAAVTAWSPTEDILLVRNCDEEGFRLVDMRLLESARPSPSEQSFAEDAERVSFSPDGHHLRIAGMTGRERTVPVRQLLWRKERDARIAMNLRD